MTIEWRDVVGYEGLYQVSSDGSVRRVNRLAKYGEKAPDKHLVQSTSTPYLTVSLCKNGRMKSFTVHSLVAEAFIGLRPIGMQCLHNNGVKRDNRPENLRWGTRADNAEDSRLHGTMAVGERARAAKLTEAEVVEIRALLKAGSRNIDLAERFGVVDSAICNIGLRRTWRHVN